MSPAWRLPLPSGRVRHVYAGGAVLCCMECLAGASACFAPAPLSPSLYSFRTLLQCTDP